MTLAKNILSFFKSLDLNVDLPAGVNVMNPFADKVAYGLCKQFYNKYYNDHNKRHLILGINPGRFGSGITGIPFTDPIRLDAVCNIQNDFKKKQELSSVFIYEMIAAFGGAENFYNQFYISSISPLGFTKGNKNLNYYDDKKLEQSIKHFVIKSLQAQLDFGIDEDIAFCLGEGKNLAYFARLNTEMKFFEKIIGLPHPRFIMQYKLKKKHAYIDRYLCELGKASTFK